MLRSTREPVAAEPFRDNAGEILRQASVALDGRPVTLWEVGDGPTLLPRASSDPQPRHHFTSVDLDSTLRRWGVPIQLGSRWLGCRLSLDGPWVIAPVRVRPPAPPPGGVERRSPTRLTLELAGLALGLSDRRETPALGRAGFFSADPIQDLLTLPSVLAPEAKNPPRRAAAHDGCRRAYGGHLRTAPAGAAAGAGGSTGRVDAGSRFSAGVAGSRPRCDARAAAVRRGTGGALGRGLGGSRVAPTRYHARAGVVDRELAPERRSQSVLRAAHEPGAQRRRGVGRPAGSDHRPHRQGR